MLSSYNNMGGFRIERLIFLAWFGISSPFLITWYRTDNAVLVIRFRIASAVAWLRTDSSVLVASYTADNFVFMD